jgi:hypothetical protein
MRALPRAARGVIRRRPDPPFWCERLRRRLRCAPPSRERAAGASPHPGDRCGRGRRNQGGSTSGEQFLGVLDPPQHWTGVWSCRSLAVTKLRSASTRSTSRKTPPPTHAVRRSGSTRTPLNPARSVTISSSATPRPAPLCPPQRTGNLCPLSRAELTVAITSPASMHRTIASGRRWTMAPPALRVLDVRREDHRAAQLPCQLGHRGEIRNTFGVHLSCPRPRLNSAMAGRTRNSLPL